MTWYSFDVGVERGVDEYIAHMLPPFGYACDVGANDGRLYSNSLHFETRGWIVLCVEPIPDLEEAGRSCRKLWRTVACGANDEEARQFAMCNGHSTWASRSTLMTDGNIPYGIEDGVEQIIDVPVRRLDRVLEEAGFPRLDYLTIDVEGTEPEVLAGFTADRWRPTIIVAESIYDDLKAPCGYEKINRISYDNVYRRTAP